MRLGRKCSCFPRDLYSIKTAFAYLRKKVNIKSLLVEDKGSSSNITKLYSLSDAKSIDFKYH